MPIRPFLDERGQRVFATRRKDLRDRMRRKTRYLDPADAKRGVNRKQATLRHEKATDFANHSATEGEFSILYKPIEEWDHEEIARGRPRSVDGKFKRKRPPWMTRGMHEEAMQRFRHIIRDEMNVQTVQALTLIASILKSKRKDARGRPIVPASTKLDAAKFLVEHALGKPKQRVESDISIRLQGLLASAVVTPGTAELPAAPHSALMAPSDDPTGTPFDLPYDILDADSIED